MNNLLNISFLSENYFEEYYFKLKNGEKEILIKRKDKKSALKAYHYYKNQGQEIEWKGKWDGHQFKDSNILQLKA